MNTDRSKLSTHKYMEVMMDNNWLVKKNRKWDKLNIKRKY